MNRKKTLISLTAALMATVAVPALAAFALTGQSLSTAAAGTIHKAGDAVFTLVDDDGEHNASRREHHSGNDDDDDDDGFSPNMAAPAGNVDPPANGLFNKGSTKPQAQVN